MSVPPSASPPCRPTTGWSSTACTSPTITPMRGTIVHNPRSNMNNAVGYAAPARFANPVALGTDGIGADMLDEFRVAFVRSREHDVTASPELAWGWLEQGWSLVPEARSDRVDVVVRADRSVAARLHHRRAGHRRRHRRRTGARVGRRDPRRRRRGPGEGGRAGGAAVRPSRGAVTDDGRTARRDHRRARHRVRCGHARPGRHGPRRSTTPTSACSG